MISKTVSATFPGVSAAGAWSVISDVDRWSAWDPGVESSSLEDGFRAGKRFKLRPKGGPDVSILLADVRDGAYFKDRTNFPLATMEGEHWYEDVAGGARMTVTMTMRGPLAFVWNFIVMRGIVANLSDDLRRLAERAKTR